MKDDKNEWVLFKLYDHTLERWSPVYCGMSQKAIILECKETAEKTNRNLTCRFVAQVIDGRVFVDDIMKDVYIKGEKDEVPATESNI